MPYTPTTDGGLEYVTSRHRLILGPTASLGILYDTSVPTSHRPIVLRHGDAEEVRSYHQQAWRAFMTVTPETVAFEAKVRAAGLDINLREEGRRTAQGLRLVIIPVSEVRDDLLITVNQVLETGATAGLEAWIAGGAPPATPETTPFLVPDMDKVGERAGNEPEPF